MLSCDATTKYCSGCGETKPTDDFYPDSRKLGRALHRCKSCIKRERSHGGVLPAISSIDAEGFWAKVDRSGGSDACWPWLRAIDGAGYGAVRINYKLYKAHRLSWILTHGELPDGMHVCHHCDNPPCANPAHLFLGTPLDNMRDREQKGRHNPARGERNSKARLTELQVRAIFAARQSGERARDIAKRFGVAKSTVEVIYAGTSWSHLRLKEQSLEPKH